MSKSLPPDRTAFFSAGLKFTLIEVLPTMPDHFSINDLRDEVAKTAKPPMNDDELKKLRKRLKDSMATYVRMNKAKLSYEKTEDMNLLIHYTKIKDEQND